MSRIVSVVLTERLVAERLGAELDARAVPRHVVVLRARDEQHVTEELEALLRAEFVEETLARVGGVLQAQLRHRVRVPHLSHHPHACESDRQQ